MPACFPLPIRPCPGDIDTVLLAKLVQLFGGTPASGDTPNNLLRKLVAMASQLQSGGASPVGSWKGTYSTLTTYSALDMVQCSGSAYISRADVNRNHFPVSSPDYWDLFVSKGATGVAGTDGADGTDGATGAAGAPGPEGPTGITSSWMGEFDAGTQYAIGEVVSYLGSSYVCLASAQTGYPGEVPNEWQVLAQGVPQDPYSWLGTYSADIPYATFDMVEYEGNYYVSRISANLNHTPGAVPLIWMAVALG